LCWQKLLPGNEALIAVLLPKEVLEIALELGITGTDVNEE